MYVGLNSKGQHTVNANSKKDEVHQRNGHNDRMGMDAMDRGINNDMHALATSLVVTRAVMLASMLACPPRTDERPLL